MLNKILEDVEINKEEIVEGLRKLISLGSSDGKASKAQEFVTELLKEIGFKTFSFREDERAKAQKDYCPYDFEYDEGAYNVTGTMKGNGNVPSLMLFAHIDTESEDYFGDFKDPYESFEKDGRVYGLGASDDMGGIAMMLYAVKYLKKYVKELPYDLCLMSILGKHGGGFGTLSALVKGYTGVNSIYLHPAETGHGFAEIKNISLGIVDFDIELTGKAGLPHDDLDTGLNAAVLAAKTAVFLEEYNQIARKENVFDFGSFEGKPSYILNVGNIYAGGDYGTINEKAVIKARARFFLPLTIEKVYEDVCSYLRKRIEEEKLPFENVVINMGSFRASPVMTENENSFIKLIEKNISKVTGINEFIHQYHGGSDIRLPMIYGNSNCVGIGPSCVLPDKNSGKREWISTDDLINGVKILASILYEYQNYS